MLSDQHSYSHLFLVLVLRSAGIYRNVKEMSQKHLGYNHTMK